MSCRSNTDLYTDTTAQPEVTSAAATTFDHYTKDGGALNATTAAERRYPGFLLDFFQRECGESTGLKTPQFLCTSL